MSICSYEGGCGLAVQRPGWCAAGHWNGNVPAMPERKTVVLCSGRGCSRPGCEGRWVRDHPEYFCGPCAQAFDALRRQVAEKESAHA